MTEAPQSTRLECPACGEDVVIHLRDGYAGDPVRCKCGAEVFNDQRSLRWAFDRVKRWPLEKTQAIAAQRTYPEFADLARRVYDQPEMATEGDLDALAAFTFLRALGLPSHAPDKVH